MNCPSRNDDDVLLHPDWNQNPPRFAADLTTCEDLNGRANARELRDAGSLKDVYDGFARYIVDARGAEVLEQLRMRLGEGVEGLHQGPCTRKTIKTAISRSAFDMPNHWGGWAFWFLSVFFVSTLVHLLGGRSGPSKFTRTLETRVSSTSLKYQPKKRDRCASGSAQPDYDMPFHVGGLFLVLFVSSTACAFPILVIKFPRLRIPASFLFCAKHFGTGVLIATAFVHLLPTAFQSLNDPCLPSFWNHDYPAIPGAIMLASVFFVAVIEMVFSPAQHVCGGNEGVEHVSRREMAEPEVDSQQDTFTTDPGRGEMRRAYSDGMRDMGRPVPLGGRATSISRTLSQYREEIQRTDETSSPGKHHSNEPSNDSQEIGSTDPHHLTPDQTRKKAVMQVFLLELGILFHSIFIGMSLAVTVGNDFVVLLIAIIFHQTFEGLALGVRIANISWPNHTPQPWVMAVAYGCTTPLGQAIGIATHTLYSPDSEIGLLVVGVMNAISAGFLVFASLVELLSEDFLSDESWKVLRGRRRVFALLLVFFGAFGMSVVGAWA